MGRKRVRVNVRCTHCGKVFEVTPSRLTHGRGKHCSRACMYAAATLEEHERAPRKRSRKPPSPRPKKRRVVNTVPREEVECATCGTKMHRRVTRKKPRHGHEYCSRPCHYAGRSSGFTGRIVAEPYDISDDAKRRQSAKACRHYADGKTFPIPETEIRVSAALGALGIDHEHQFVIDLATRSVVVDFAFTDRRLIVEVDEPSLHRKPRIAEMDKVRDAELADAGWTVRRVKDDRDVRAITARVLRAIA